MSYIFLALTFFGGEYIRYGKYACSLWSIGTKRSHQMKQCIMLTSILCTIFFTTLSHATPAVGSREYKLMLNPALFNGATPKIAISNYWNELHTLLQSGTINRETNGLFRLKKQRTVKFYDTPSSCVLRNKGYSFRERVENNLREVTLKYRSYDRFISGHKNMQGDANRNPVTKFEEDISPPFISKYSHSTSQSIGAGKNLNDMNDPIGLYQGLLTYGFNPKEPIALVNNLIISEKVYKGVSVDLGKLKAKFSLTLWYDTNTSTTPVVAEISFKYKDTNENYSDNVTQRALAIFEIMQNMPHWVSTTSLTKTAFVFAYATPEFCN
ncbi:MAG: hypothetical protein Q9N67_03545 [Ghiorsea sp.]|nr:hypothetical protein [Ghiorsea sp.]